MEVLGSSCESQGGDQGLALYLRECTEYRMYCIVEWQTKQIMSVFLNAEVEPFYVLKVASLRVKMSQCRRSVVRLNQVMSFKALRAWSKWISFLILLNLGHAVVNFFPQLWGLQQFWNLHMARWSELGCHEYDETKKDVVRAGSMLVITGFLPDKVTEVDWNFYLGVSLHLQKKGCISEQ